VPETFGENLKRFADLGLDVAITELDVRYQLPGSAEKTAKQAQDYEHVVSTCMSVARCVGVTVWGFTDKYTWDVEPGYGEQDMWTKDYQAKSAVAAVEKVLK
jgi:endo-1,4-beta-xylanase